MKLQNAKADVFIPDGADPDAAMKRTTHLGIGAHQDDLEIMAYHGILQCYDSTSDWFTAVTCTDGAGSARAGKFARYTDEEMQRVRLQEQKEAARVGRYAAALQLGYSSKEVKASPAAKLEADLAAIVLAANPRVIYTHNPADKHPTHVAVMGAAIRALRSLPRERRPQWLFGCEVWRDLDWLSDRRKVVLDVSRRKSLAESLVKIFESQIAGGKRYDLASLGRRRANATYLDSHATDTMDAAIFAMDLTPVLYDDSLDIMTYTTAAIDEFRQSVAETLVKVK